LKAIFRDNPFNTSDGNEIPILVQFLGNDLRRHVGVEKPVPYDLTHDLMGSPVVALWSWFEAFEPLRPLIHKLRQDLVIALSSIAKLFCGLGRAKTFTVALKKHRKLKGDFIIFPDGKRPF
jgi:hypothetical protein